MLRFLLLVEVRALARTLTAVAHHSTPAAAPALSKAHAAVFDPLVSVLAPQLHLIEHVLAPHFVDLAEFDALLDDLLLRVEHLVVQLGQFGFLFGFQRIGDRCDGRDRYGDQQNGGDQNDPCLVSRCHLASRPFLFLS